MNIYQYDPNLSGKDMPPNMGSTGDDRMDIACSIAHCVPDLATALLIAENILASAIWSDVTESWGR